MSGFTPLSEQVYNYVVEQIEAGGLVEGSRVVELSLCDALGVSRTPVREALGRLANDGFLSGSPDRKSVV